MAKVSLRSYNREIEAMIDRGQLDEAVAHCHHILKTFPKHLETYRLLGKAYLESKRYGDAVDIFQRILASAPNDFVAQVGMSIIRDEENKLNDAIWHMERAFETQPSNAAIQSELQRLYARRDGVQPPRIRMTRGALAHMYVQGELYPQAISEIKSVLKEDPERNDMQTLLARACYKSGAKNDAVDAALAVLQRYPYSLDANRVLVEVLSADRNENAQAYRQRLVELDPYAAQVTGSVFQSNDVSDAAVSLERLDWNGQPVGMQSDWREAQAIGLESGAPADQEPDWLKNSYESTQAARFDQAQREPSQLTPASMFDDVTPAAAAPVQPADEIPDFMKAAGWGEASGAFDESKPIFGDDEPAASAAQPIEQGDLPDWVKAMAPQAPAQNAQEEEVLPDWINNIGPGGTLSSQPADQPDWMSSLEQPSTPATSETHDQSDWMNQFSQSESAAAQPAADQPDWLQGLGTSSDFTPQAAQTDVPDWMKGLGEETPVAPSMPDAGAPDWMSGLGEETPSTSTASSDVPGWMQGLGDETPAAPTETGVPDWLSGLGEENPTVTSAQSDTGIWMSGLGNATPAEPAAQSDLPDWVRGIGEETPAATAAADETDWMKGLGEPSKQAAETDWLKQLDEQPPAEETSSAPVDFDFLNDLAQESTAQVPSAEVPAASTPDALGVSDQERDDAFAWLENLAAKQGASEGLLTRPEDRLEEEPEWVKQAKGLTDLPATSETPVATPPASFDELGKSEEEQDDSFAWLENLAAKQGVSEGLLTKPEDRLQEEREWVKQAKDLQTTPAASVEELGKSEQERDDSFSWLESLAAKQGASEGLLTKPEDRLQEEPEWVRQAKESMVQPPPISEAPAELPAVNMEELGKSEQERDDSFSWLENLAAKQGATEGLLTQPEDRLQEEPEWVKQAKESAVQQPPAAETPAEPAIANAAELGKSEQERDDSFAWLESLAAKHGASEGLLTKPEERLQEEPEWVKQAKESTVQQPPVEPQPEAVRSTDTGELGKSSKEQDDSFAWLENLAAKQGATEGLLTKPEERLQEEPEWVKQVKDLSAQQQPEPVSEQPEDTEAWLKDLAEKESTPGAAAQMLDVNMPSWMDNIQREETPAVESTTPVGEVTDHTEWIGTLESPAPVEEEKSEDEELPSWLSELEQEEKQIASPGNQDDLPEWLRGEDIAPSDKPEPTRVTDWKPAEVKPAEPELVYSPPVEEKPSEPEIIYSPPLMEEIRPEPEPASAEPLSPVTFEIPEQEPRAVEPEQHPEPEAKEPAPRSTTPVAPPRYVEPVTRRGTGMLVMPGVDSMLGLARSELSRSNIPGALDSYGKLIKKARFLDEVIHDLREALYRYPVEVNIWQSLGDAYMRANRLQDALDAYTKAEELLR